MLYLLPITHQILYCKGKFAYSPFQLLGTLRVPVLAHYFLFLALLHLGVEGALECQLLADEGRRCHLFLQQVPPQHY